MRWGESLCARACACLAVTVLWSVGCQSPGHAQYSGAQQYPGGYGTQSPAYPSEQYYYPPQQQGHHQYPGQGQYYDPPPQQYNPHGVPVPQDNDASYGYPGYNGGAANPDANTQYHNPPRDNDMDFWSLSY